ncbi:hypothetical protein HRbin30_00864 [bacterium HR30]|nr:hypothetical protein HRbin30_00864 [bacterium HR30]
MGWLEYTILSFTTLFVIVDPIAVVPAFLAMTPDQSSEARLNTARVACSVAAGVLFAFTILGEAIFRYLHVSPAAFQIAGSILLLRIALDMLHGQRSAAQETNEEVLAGAAKEDVAVSPLAVPMLAGPGAISTSLILFQQAGSLLQRLTLFVVIALVALVSYGIFALAVHGIHRVSPLALKLVNRLMGLLLAAVAVQFALDALAQLRGCES